MLSDVKRTTKLTVKQSAGDRLIDDEEEALILRRQRRGREMCSVRTRKLPCSYSRFSGRISLAQRRYSLVLAQLLMHKEVRSV